MLPNFSYIRVASVAEAVRHLTAPGARVHAGGTDLLGCLRDRVFTADKVVSLGRIEALRGISPSGTGLRIGALTPIAAVASDKQVREQYAALAQAADSIGSPQLRNQGTIGGNICQRPRCWYFRGDFHCTRKGGETCFAMAGENQYHAIFGGSSCYMVHPSDTAPALIALRAQARISGPAGARMVPLASFFLLPDKSVVKETVLERGEVVTDILLPAPDAGVRSAYRKVRARGSWDFALASVALAVKFAGETIESARIVLGAAAPVPWRAIEAEKAIVGQRLTPEVAARAGEAAVQGAQSLAHNEYKIRMFPGVVEEALIAIARA
jgi:xanthine dehydrogenase YagS FAD-binding subunit